MLLTASLLFSCSWEWKLGMKLSAAVSFYSLASQPVFPAGSRDYHLFNLLLLQSESNVQGVLVSDPEYGVNSYGLTDLGKQQAIEVPMTLFLR